MQLCGHFQWESHTDCPTILTTFSRKDETTDNVRSTTLNNVFFSLSWVTITRLLILLSITLAALLFVVDQARSDQFIFVGGLAGCLSFYFLQVSRSNLSSDNLTWHTTQFRTKHFSCFAVSCMLWLTSCSLLTVLWALLIALLGKPASSFKFLEICIYLGMSLLAVFLFGSNCTPCQLQNT